jgi:hypothetical protein
MKAAPGSLARPSSTAAPDLGAGEQPVEAENVVVRLKIRIREVRAMGFHVRQELLGGHRSNCCEIAGRKTMFLDASQSAREQLASIDEALASYYQGQSAEH